MDLEVISYTPLSMSMKLCCSAVDLFAVAIKTTGHYVLGSDLSPKTLALERMGGMNGARVALVP